MSVIRRIFSEVRFTIQVTLIAVAVGWSIGVAAAVFTVVVRVLT